MPTFCHHKKIQIILIKSFLYKCALKSLPCKKRVCLQSPAHVIVREQKTLGHLTATTEAGILVSTLKHFQTLDNPEYKVFTFIEKYKQTSIKEYKTKRFDLHAPYLM